MKKYTTGLIALVLCLCTLFLLGGCAKKDAFDKFIDGKVTATDLQSQDINIETYLQQTAAAFNGEYAKVDVTGDGQPELCIRTTETLTIFALNQESLQLLREFSKNCIVLNNGAIFETVSNPVYGTTEYCYTLLDENGKDKEVTTFTSDPVGKKYTYNGKAVTAEEYATATKPIFDINNDQLEWFSLS